MPGVKANTQKKGGDDKKAGGGGAAGKAARLEVPIENSRVCEMCKIKFNIRTARVMLAEHVDSKHSKQGFEACFPGFVDPKA